MDASDRKDSGLNGGRMHTQGTNWIQWIREQLGLSDIVFKIIIIFFKLQNKL